ncbi:DUF7848 domain-containing protein [Streptomyces sp. H27-D2]
MRFVEHSIRHVPDAGITFEAFCLACQCDERSGPNAEQEPAQD